MPTGPRSAGRARRGLGWFLVVLAVGAAAGWSGRELLVPPQPLAASPDYALVAAREGSVGQSIQLNASAQWRDGLPVSGEAEGIVTELLAQDGGLLHAGDLVLRVGLRPVAVGEGDTPTFRELSEGSRGPDVEQLQTLLAGLDHQVNVDGTFDAQTAEAVAAWQEDLGVQPTGTVQQGDLVFVPELPARFAFADGIRVGSRVAAGESLGKVLPEEPTFSIVLPQGQAELVQAGQAVTITTPSGVWLAVVDSVGTDSDESGNQAAQLAPAPGEDSICASSCEGVAIRGATLFPSVVQVIPEVDGIVVPASAVVTTADDQTAVVLEDGTVTGVSVLAGAFGTVVVDGLSEGQLVRAPALLPADPPETAPAGD